MANTTPASLQQKFNLPNVLRFSDGPGGLTKLSITGPAADAEIYLHGAHVTHFQPKGEKPVLMVSRKSAFQQDKPIRGGVPICWPWFGPREGDPKAAIHGFARLSDWTLDSVTQLGDAVQCVFTLQDTPATLAIWPHKFRLRYTITVGRSLSLAFETINTDDKPFTFTQALHPYFVVSDVRQISITGLENTSYSERIYTPDVQQQGGDPIRFTRRTDRVYYDTRTSLTIHDPGLSRRITETKENSNTTVVWNPWDEWPKTVPDFAEDEWPGMVCVEPSNAHHFAITLNPGQSHTLRARIEVQKA